MVKLEGGEVPGLRRASDNGYVNKYLRAHRHLLRRKDCVTGKAVAEGTDEAVYDSKGAKKSNKGHKSILLSSAASERVAMLCWNSQCPSLKAV
ncbi:hypothetical protein Ancab_033902 [Ancistrocladus abbreviatus]